MRFGQLPAAEAGAFHFFEQTSHRAIAVDRHWSRRNGQVLARFWFSLCHHKLVLPLVKMFTASHLPPSPYRRGSGERALRRKRFFARFFNYALTLALSQSEREYINSHDAV